MLGADGVGDHVESPVQLGVGGAVGERCPISNLRQSDESQSRSALAMIVSSASSNSIQYLSA